MFVEWIRTNLSPRQRGLCTEIIVVVVVKRMQGRSKVRILRLSGIHPHGVKEDLTLLLCSSRRRI